MGLLILTVVSSLLVSLLCYDQFKKLSKKSIYKIVLKCLLYSCLVSIFALLNESVSMWVIVGFGSAILFFCLFCLGIDLKSSLGWLKGKE